MCEALLNDRPVGMEFASPPPVNKKRRSNFSIISEFSKIDPVDHIIKKAPLKHFEFMERSSRNNDFFY